MIKKHPIDFQKARQYFEESLIGVNQLADSVMSFLHFELGDFFIFLSENSAIDSIYDFKSGGKTNCLRGEAAEFIFDYIQSHKNTICIFDDFNADKKNICGDNFFDNYGLFCDKEIYYLINRNATANVVSECLQRSNVIWHSLCVLSATPLNNHKKIITLNELQDICVHAQVVLLGAYDAESYVVWERREGSQ